MTSTEMQRCIQECERCHDACLRAVTYCLRKGERYEDASHITALLDCAEMCQTCASFMLRESPRHQHTCGVCAVMCDACAKSCAAFEGDDEMEQCRAQCHRCAASCREMAAIA